jgi:hypothetical protein
VEAQPVLDHSIFERMKRDDHQSPPRGESRDSRIHKFFQARELLIDRNP